MNIMLPNILKRCERCMKSLSSPLGREQIVTFIIINSSSNKKNGPKFYSSASAHTPLMSAANRIFTPIITRANKVANQPSLCSAFHHQTPSLKKRTQQQHHLSSAHDGGNIQNNCNNIPMEHGPKFFTNGLCTAASAEGSSQVSTDSGEQKKSRWSNWTGKNSWKSGLLFLGLGFGGIGISLIYTWGEPSRDQDGEIIRDAFMDKPAPIAYTLRATNAVRDFFQMVQAPTSEKLLPDPLVAPYVQPPYTLVLELSGLLLKPEWDMKMGWRFKKRPGLDYFLQTCAQSGFEVVIFTLEPTSVGYPLTVSMDPQGVIWYRLFKEDTRYTSGVHIKDLGCLNRDLSKVILLDVSKSSFQMNPRNGIAVKKWDGAESDRELYDLAAFLQTVASNKVEDIRTVIQHYNQFDDPMAKFRENQAAVLKAHEEMMKLQEEDKKAQTTKSPFLAARRR